MMKTGLDIVLVAAFRESSFLQGLGITIIKSLEKPRHKPVFLFCFSESDFQNPHYQSVRPNREENVLLTFLSSNTKTIDGSRSSILQESCVGSRLEMEDGSWTESIDNIEVLVTLILMFPSVPRRTQFPFLLIRRSLQ